MPNRQRQPPNNPDQHRLDFCVLCVLKCRNHTNGPIPWDSALFFAQDMRDDIQICVRLLSIHTFSFHNRTHLNEKVIARPTMDALLQSESSSYDEKSDLRSSLCYYLSIILVLLAFILSMFSLGFCSAVMCFPSLSLLVYHPEQAVLLLLPYMGPHGRTEGRHARVHRSRRQRLPRRWNHHLPQHLDRHDQQEDDEREDP